MLVPSLILLSCADSNSSTPPRIALGQTDCAECGMIVSDERYACASIIQTDSQRTEPRVFDDINCLVLHEVTGSNPPEVVARWVHDKDTLAWIAAGDAHFVWAKDLATPMMSHIAAFASKQSADTFQDQTGGQAMTFDEVLREFTPEHLRDTKP